MASSSEKPVVVHGVDPRQSIRIVKVLRRWYQLKHLLLIIALILLLWYTVLIHFYPITSTISYIAGLRDLSSFTAPSLVWKFGITMLCDKHDDIEYLVTETISAMGADGIRNFDRFAHIMDGDVIWIKGAICKMERYEGDVNLFHSTRSPRN